MLTFITSKRCKCNGNLICVCLRFNSIELLIVFATFSGVDLRWIDHPGNVLTGTLPAQLGLLTNLETLILGQNSFSGLPGPAFPINLVKIQNVDLSGNYFTGSIPGEVLRLPTLQVALVTT